MSDEELMEHMRNFVCEWYGCDFNLELYDCIEYFRMNDGKAHEDVDEHIFCRVSGGKFLRLQEN